MWFCRTNMLIRRFTKFNVLYDLEIFYIKWIQKEDVNLELQTKWDYVLFLKILDISTISLHSVFQPILYKVLVPKKTFFIVLIMFYSPEFVSAWLNCWHVMVRSVFPRALQWVLTFCLGVISQHCVMACSQIVIVSVTQRQFSVVRVNIPQEKLCLYV